MNQEVENILQEVKADLKAEAQQEMAAQQAAEEQARQSLATQERERKESLAASAKKYRIIKK